jgi:outer membrane immunogenic protein
MKRMLSCAVALLAILTTDAVAEGPAASRPWTGFYIALGVGAGAVVQTQTLRDEFGPLFTQSVGGQGLLGTVAAGYDFRVMPRVVAGAFFDYDISNISNDNPALFPISVPYDHKHTWSVGGRLGYLATPTTLWYVLGGYSRAGFDFDTLGRVDFGGYFVGGGVETQLTGGWSLRGEYRFTRFSTETLLEGGCFCSETLEAETSMHSGRILLVYKFGAGSESQP